LWIAAQAIEQRYTLLTLNRDGFAGLPGLRLTIFAASMQRACL
jgi:predicted nucleic acid-binding protein